VRIEGRVTATRRPPPTRGEGLRVDSKRGYVCPVSLACPLRRQSVVDIGRRPGVTRTMGDDDRPNVAPVHHRLIRCAVGLRVSRGGPLASSRGMALVRRCVEHARADGRARDLGVSDLWSRAAHLAGERSTRCVRT